MSDQDIRGFQETAAAQMQRLLVSYGLAEPTFERGENEEFTYLATSFVHAGHRYDLSIQEDEISLVVDRKHYSCEMAAGYADRQVLLKDFAALLDRLLRRDLLEGVKKP